MSIAVWLNPGKKSLVNNVNKYLLNKDDYWYKESEGYKKNSVNVYFVPFNKIFPTNAYNIFRHIWTGKGYVLIGHKEKPTISKAYKERYLKWKKEVYPTLEKDYYK